jgi:prepilin-type N-terminal cleavage/methylation domain-containing protein
MSKNNISTNQKGFTLVEAMVATALFLVIITTGITALLSVNSTLKKTQTQRVALDTISFIMEDMTRYLRLGNLTNCRANGAQFVGDEIETLVQDGDGLQCMAIATEPFTSPNVGDPEDQVVYWIAPSSDDPDRGVVFKAPTGNSNLLAQQENWFVMTPAEIDIDLDRSGFTVVGSEVSGPTDGLQPRVIIRLAGTVTFRDIESDFSVQTTVSQRFLDL